MRIVAEASPSLALIKYWGKLPGGVNLPATSSLAVTLDGLRSRTVVSAQPPGSTMDDEVFIDGAQCPLEPYRAVIEAATSGAGASDPVESSASADKPGQHPVPAGDAPSAPRRPLRIESSNDFPTAAGLASSSSGFAALALALDRHAGAGHSVAELSSIARLGSGSAARAVYGGFTVWRAGEDHAEPLAPATHWPELRIVIVVLQSSPKPVSSRAGMDLSRATSPFYEAWVKTSDDLFESGREAVLARDIDGLGRAMRQNYLRMFSTMFTADPPFIYWLPESVAVIRLCEELRSAGVPVWETMDAGPQVKLVTFETAEPEVIDAVHRSVPDASVVSSRVGEGPVVREQPE